MKYEAVIFDFDGVIGKTMEDNYRAWSKAFGHYNISLGKEEYFLLEGMNCRGVAETILRKNGIDIAFIEIVAELKEKYYTKNNTFEFYPGILRLINELKGRFKLGLVSGAGSRRLRETMAEYLLKKFEVVITGDAVEKSKPHPEPYLVAAKKLSVTPLKCLVIENAPLGIESAKTACMDCVAVCSTLDRKYLSRADFIVEDISSLHAFFNNIQK